MASNYDDACAQVEVLLQTGLRGHRYKRLDACMQHHDSNMITSMYMCFVMGHEDTEMRFDH